MFGPSLIAPALILRRRRGAKALPILGSNRRKLEGSRHGRCHYGSSDMHQCRLQVTFQPTVVTHLANEHLSPTLLASRSTCIFVIDQPLDSFWAVLLQRVALSNGLMAHSVWPPTEICITASFFAAAEVVSPHRRSANPLLHLLACTARPGPSLCK